MHNVAVDFRFVPLRPQDIALLATWLARPHVARWWREPFELEAVERNYGPLTEGIDPTEAFIVHLSDRPIGYVQRYLIEDNPDWLASLHTALGLAGGIGIDYLIGEEDLVGIGLGRQMISQFAESCWNRYPLADQIVVALQQENVASGRAIEAAGFRRVWSGTIESSDPSDRGPSFIYVSDRVPG